jgi:hypothetical protein
MVSSSDCAGTNVMSQNAKAAKQQRLAQALRANLKRRKEAAGRVNEETRLPPDGAGAGHAAGATLPPPLATAGREHKD